MFNKTLMEPLTKTEKEYYEDSMKKGVKLDSGKLEYAKYLAHFPNAIKNLIEVATYGGEKYKETGTNWRVVDNAKKRYTEAMMRHILAYIFGEEIDKESGHHHLSHALWNICAVIELLKQGD